MMMERPHQGRPVKLAPAAPRVRLERAGLQRAELQRAELQQAGLERAGLQRAGLPARAAWPVAAGVP